MRMIQVTHIPVTTCRQHKSTIQTNEVPQQLFDTFVFQNLQPFTRRQIEEYLNL